MSYDEFLRQPAAWFHSRILVGPGAFLTPSFVEKHNIKYVVNCSFNEYSPPWFRQQYQENYTVLNAIDSPHHNILEWYPIFEKTMDNYLATDETGVVYVHCQAGMNRSASLALAYVATHFNPNIEQLIVLTKQQRNCMYQNRTFMKQVEEFVNGRIQNKKSTRDIKWNGRGDIGFRTPRYNTNTKRVGRKAITVAI